MADTGELRITARDAVVRPFARAVTRPCARPGCSAPAASTLSFRYATREAWLGELASEPMPAGYDLCPPHADRTRPPAGWELVDRRAEMPTGASSGPPEDLGSDHTVAVLAAALRTVAGGGATEPSPVLGAEETDDADTPPVAPPVPAGAADAEPEPAAEDADAPEVIDLEPAPQLSLLDGGVAQSW